MLQIQVCLLQDLKSVACILCTESYLGPSSSPIRTPYCSEAHNQILADENIHLANIYQGPVLCQAMCSVLGIQH